MYPSLVPHINVLLKSDNMDGVVFLIFFLLIGRAIVLERGRGFRCRAGAYVLYSVQTGEYLCWYSQCHLLFTYEVLIFCYYFLLIMLTTKTLKCIFTEFQFFCCIDICGAEISS